VQQAAPVQESILDGSWIQQLVDRPESFTALIDGPSRGGWVALHGNDFESALQAFDPAEPTSSMARGRALWELSALFADLARTGDLAWEGTFTTWSEKSSIPAGSALTYVAGVAALEQGDTQVSQAWFKLTANASDPLVASSAAMVTQLSEGTPLEADQEPPFLVGRYQLHQQARASGDLGTIIATAHQPLVVESEQRPDGTTLQREFYDPQLLGTLAAAYRRQAAEALGVDDPLVGISRPAEGVSELGALIFGPVLRFDSLEAEGSRASALPGALGASSTLLASLGLEPDLPPEDDADWARNQVRSLDERLDAWSEQAREGANEDGLALLDDLQLVRIFRSRLLLARARSAMAAGHPWQAHAFAQLALDLESSRGITPVNHPGLQALIVESQLHKGHTREALDALQPLLGAYPALTGLDEVLGDLAILQGLDRYGDSKEN